MDLKEIFTLLVTIGGWCVSIGLYIGKIKSLEKEMSEVKNRQTKTDELLLNISNQLAELNSKVGLLIQGKVKSNG